MPVEPVDGSLAVYDICRLQTADRRLQTSDCRLQTADHRPQTADQRKNKNKGDFFHLRLLVNSPT